MSLNTFSEADDDQLLEALESGNYERLLDLQRNSTRSNQLRLFYQRLATAITNVEPSISQEALSQFLELVKTNLKEFIVVSSDFTIDSVLSWGGFSTVFRGKLQYSDVAIKRVFLGSNFAQIQKTLNETFMLAKIRHPNILLCKGVSLDEESNLYIISQLLKWDLAGFLKANGGKVSLQNKLKILIQTAFGMAYLHSLCPPVIHRDIKPQNILLTQNLDVKIADFGLAKALAVDQDDLKSLTVATLEYMSPETLNDSVYFAESDVYSFGVLAFETIFGREYIHLRGFNLINSIVNDKHEPNYSGFNESPQLVELIKRCVAHQHTARPTFKQIVEELEEISVNLPE